jgi:dihydroorotate dehydrogenase
MAQRGFAPRHRPSGLEQSVSFESVVFGKTFPNPIGLGAGFDKDGAIVQPMLDLGFGFVEVGTVTPEPQAGNAKPRMFRLVEDYGIVNRYGFNSQGVAAVEANLKQYRKDSMPPPPPPPPDADTETPESDTAGSTIASTLRWMWMTLYPEQHAVGGIVGVNIGKNKLTEDAAQDFCENIRRLGRPGPGPGPGPGPACADYLVINISSPNTPGLRDWQDAAKLESLLQTCIQTRNALGEGSNDNDGKRVPLLVKLAPDLTDDDMKDIARVLVKSDIDGIVVTNTTNQRPDDLISKHRVEVGGLSGAPVRDKSTEVIRTLFALTDGNIPIIGVGGVGSGHDAYVKLKAGASLVQVYSMMVYKGPGVVSKIRKELAELMLQNGQRSIEDVVGMDHDDIFWRKREEHAERARQKIGSMAVIDIDP